MRLPLLLPVLVLAGCASRVARPSSGATPVPTASTTPATGWLEPSRRGSIIEATPPPAGTLFYGVALVDTAANRVFVTGSDGSLDAVELETGALVFHHPEPAGAIRRLGGGALAAIDAGTHLLVLDERDGHTLFVSAPTGYPGEIVRSVSVGKESLRVAWLRYDAPRGGAYRPPSTAEGAYTVGLRDGAVSAEPVHVSVAGPIASLPAFSSGAVALTVEMAQGGFRQSGFIESWKRALVARRGDTVVWSHPVVPRVQSFAPIP